VKKRRRTEVTVETDEVIVIRRSGSTGVAWCPQCAETVRMLTPEEAAVLACGSAREIYRLVEAGKIHNTETDEGLLFVCLKSVSFSLNG
jgi:hypothetical protein